MTSFVIYGPVPLLKSSWLKWTLGPFLNTVHFVPLFVLSHTRLLYPSPFLISPSLSFRPSLTHSRSRSVAPGCIINACTDSSVTHWLKSHSLPHHTTVVSPRKRNSGDEHTARHGGPTFLSTHHPPPILCCFIIVIERETGAEQNSGLCSRGPVYIMHSTSWNISLTDPQIFLKAQTCFTPYSSCIRLARY